jgi:hypothetical protein
MMQDQDLQIADIAHTTEHIHPELQEECHPAIPVSGRWLHCKETDQHKHATLEETPKEPSPETTN